jgi:hypothetical protein
VARTSCEVQKEGATRVNRAKIAHKTNRVVREVFAEVVALVNALGWSLGVIVVE